MKSFLLLSCSCCLLAVYALANTLDQPIQQDLSKAVVVLPQGEVPSSMSAAAEMLSIETGKRCGKPLAIKTGNDAAASEPRIILTLRDQIEKNHPDAPAEILSGTGTSQAEKFQIVSHQSTPMVWIVGDDGRGVLAGAGYLLRKMAWKNGQALFPVPFEFSSKPVLSPRGHQIGFRPRANSWDAWTTEQMETYIREMVIFGTNAIENIPFQDTDPSPLMRVSREDMNKEMSRICAKYGIEYWVWTPAEFPLDDQAKRDELLEEHEAFYQSIPRLDGVFVPGGDPGDNPPNLVLALLKDLYERLHRYHPEAGVWMSMQGYDPKEVDQVLEYLRLEKPDWIRGIVAGPSSPSIPEIRRRLPEKYLIRDYPDITHTVRCQYPVPWWDNAYALTLGRECINPRPVFYTRVVRYLTPFLNGFISYSDGVHDDVNKALWSLLGWDPNLTEREILKDYANFFFGTDVAEKAADGIFALERNWDGVLLKNGSVDATQAYWKSLEDQNPQLGDNWRWLMLVFRAHYDYYIRHRLIFETDLENQVNHLLAQAPQLGSESAMNQSERVLKRQDTETPNPDIRKHIDELAEKLFQTIQLQTSVPKYKASGAERGASMDFIDRPINNRWWLEDEFKAIRAMPNEADRLARLKIIAEWENPGEGSFYDDVGELGKSEHVVMGESVNTDPTMERNPPPTYLWWDSGMSRRRLSWPSFLDWPNAMRYEGLDPQAHYTIRITGQKDCFLRIDGKPVLPSRYSTNIGEFKEFPVPQKDLKDGVLILTWDPMDEEMLNWRQRSHLSEVWLLKNNNH